MNDKRGSLWRKWDLHVHTPNSFVHEYRCSQEEDVWEKFISDIESLPEDIKVLGINDYIFIDGYMRILEFKRAGRMPNIDLFLPVIELRLNKFGGSNSNLKRVNYHIIFSNDLSPEVIQSHFLNALTSKYRLNPVHTNVTWDGVITKESLAELGKAIKESVPEEQRHHYDSDIKEGFNNLNLDLIEIEAILSGTRFKGKHLTAVGKTEWSDIRWNNQSIADKKSIINGVDFVFISSQNPDHFLNAKGKLISENVNSRLLDCSDAHRFSNSQDKDRLGKCFTWLKCDTTFEGLKQIRNEFNSRVFVGDVPPKLEKVRNNPTKYIHSISVSNIDKDKNGSWFDSEINLNHDLVAVIGNKGSGKSAFADILGLLGNTKNYSDFSFLTKQKFRKLNIANDFEATIIWESGTTETKNLGTDPQEHETEKIKYLPQQFIEKLCNVDDEKFEEELKEVIFSHVLEKDRLKQSSLNDLIKVKTDMFKNNIEVLSDELQVYNETIIKLEKLKTSKYKKYVEEQLRQKEENLSVHNGLKPDEVQRVEADPGVQEHIFQVSSKIDELNKEINSLKLIINEKYILQSDVEEKLSYIQKIVGYIETFKKQYEGFISSCQKEADVLKIDLRSIVSLTVNEEILLKGKEDLQSLQKQLNDVLVNDTDQNLLNRKSDIQEQINKLQSQLDEPQRKYQLYQKSLAEWTEKQKVLEKELSDLKEEKQTIIEKNEEDLKELKEKREAKLKEVHKNILDIKEVYQELYNPVQLFVSGHSLSDGNFKLNFEVSIEIKGFINKFLSKVNQNTKGPFYGKEEGRKVLEDLIETHDFNDTDSTISFIKDLLILLSSKDENEPETFNVENQLTRSTNVVEVYEFLYSLSYLKPIYSLQLGEKELKTLSPGEKGALLLIFYLLVDNDDIPLIIDQPEENLDNQTVFNLLVPCIKEAKNRRQIIIVTHNPNLAVVCDAEQIIYTSMDKADNNKVKYVSGSIESPTINSSIIDVLEGTVPAFKNRESKYYIQ